MTPEQIKRLAVAHYLIAAKIDGEIRYLQTDCVFPYNHTHATHWGPVKELQLTPIKWGAVADATRWHKGAAKIWWNWIFRVVRTAEVRVVEV